MGSNMRVRSFLGAIALFALSAAVSSQPVSFRTTCHSVGSSPPEPLAGRENQTVAVGTYVCATEGGPLDGSMLTGNAIWHYERQQGRLLSGNGIYRRPGMHAAYEMSGGNIELLMTDGRVTGFTGTGAGRFSLATGAAAALNGKTYKFRFQAIGPGRFAVEHMMD